MNKKEFDAFEQEMRDNHVFEYVLLKQEDVLYSQRLRDNCEFLCPNYNTNWSCPPHAGAIDDNICKCRNHKYALLVTGWIPLDDKDLAKQGPRPLFVMSRKKSNPGFLKLGKKLEALSGNPALILRTFCVLCDTCSFPEEPCRFPDKRSFSMESHGVMMVTMMEKYGVQRYSGDQGYTCASLMLFDTEFDFEPEFGVKKVLQDYPSYVEAQHYLDSLYEAGEVSSKVDLSSCDPWEAGIYPLNGAGPEDICYLSCNAKVTVPLFANEVKLSGMPINLLVMDTHNHTVNHAYSEGIMVTDTIRRFILSYQDQVQSRKLVIPNALLMIQRSLERALPGWEIIVGPEVMCDFSKHLKGIL